MADINVPLLVALGDRAAPQHKVRGQEAFEFSEGSDGALHTKIVDQNGNPISSINKLQVADTDVKAELEQIKQQQQQILQRLNQPIDTQLTGSNLGYTVVTNQVVPAGSTYLSNDIVFKGTRLALGIRFNATTQFEVRLAIYSPDTNLSIGKDIIVINQTTADRGYGDTKLFSNRGAIVVYNRGQNDVTIQRLAVTEFMASGNGGEE